MPDVSEQPPAAGTGDTPCLPDGAACFPPEAGIDAAGLAARLAADLERLREATQDDPLTSPVLLLGLRLTRELAAGRLGFSALEQVIQHLTAEGFAARAARLGRALGATDPEVNAARLSALFEALTRPDSGPGGGAEGDGDRVPFDTFRGRVERALLGIVITAHPTFSLTTPLMRDLGALATGFGADGAALTDAERAVIVARAARSEHRPDADMSLAREHALSVEAIANIQAALRRVYALLFAVAQRRYPERWTQLRPGLLTVASWVGYDLDGRSDIRWTDILHKRLTVQAGQLQHYLDTVRALRTAATTEPHLPAALGDTLELMESRLALALSQIGDEQAVFAAVSPGEDSRDRIRRLSRRMFEGRTLRLTEAGTLTAIIDRALCHLDGLAADDGDPGAAIAHGLCVLRTELSVHGLGLAHSHVRINATQVHNAIRKAVGLTADPNDPRYRQSYLDRISALLDTVEPVRINFGSLLEERTSVKQLFMVVAQMLKYCDRTAPVRFLIAECESAFTVLAALYFARLFGVDGQVDISPLFETETALEAGSRFIDQLLENPHYRAYVEARGRLAVQTGYSDAGRYLGQTAAAASIERLRLRLIRVLARHRLHDVELLIFDTHGESIGRGAHPAGFPARLAYVDPPATRAALAEAGIPFKQEVSFQGGDGYHHFINPAGAFAVVTRLIEHALDPMPAADDPFYAENAYVREFFTTVKDFQVELMRDPDYGVLLGAFGPSLLFRSGSRAFRRQHESPAELDGAQARQIRAIPHNAVLMQLGLLANSTGGIGAAMAKDPTRFRSLYRRSARFRLLLGIAEYGAAVSDPEITHGYVALHDPGFWIARGATPGDPEAAAGHLEPVLRLAGYLEPAGLQDSEGRVLRRLRQDLTELHAGLAGLRREAEAPAGCDALADPRSRTALCLLHAIRLALIQELFVLAVKVPDFSSRHDVTLKQLISRLLHLDVEPVAETLEDIFPRTEPPAEDEDFGEPADYRSDDSQSYRHENDTLFRPMRGLSILIRRISTAIAHHVGFFG